MKFMYCNELLFFHSCKDDILYSKYYSGTTVKNMVDVHSYEWSTIK